MEHISQESLRPAKGEVCHLMPSLSFPPHLALNSFLFNSGLESARKARFVSQIKKLGLRERMELPRNCGILEFKNVVDLFLAKNFSNEPLF